VNRDQSQHFPPVPAAPRPDVGQGGGSGGGSGSSYSISSSLGGGSASGGGDPTTTGRAQVVGNRQLDKLPLAAGYYDYANDGLRWGTDDDEFNFGIRAMQQIDARIYANPNQEYASSGIFNPRTRLYFYGHLTRPLSVGKTLSHAARVAIRLPDDTPSEAGGPRPYIWPQSFLIEMNDSWCG
jgi:hypothetical protein